MMPMKGLIDTTLREGEQRVGVYFSDAERLHIFEGLCRTGVEEIEVGVCATRNQQAISTFFGCCRERAGQLSRPPRLALWSRCRRDDMELAAELQPDILALCVPASDLHLKERLGLGRTELLSLLRRLLPEARRKFPYLSIGFEDASRADRAFLTELLHVAGDCGANRVRLADTVGIFSPGRIQALIDLARRSFPGEIGMHCHNDFGMATANAVAALESGAAWADVTLLGLGERAGNARLEEIAAYLAVNGHVDCDGRGYDLAAIKILCQEVASMTGQHIPASKAIVGSGLFACESGLHAAAIQRTPATYEPFAPERVGAQRQLLYGAKTGRRAIAGKLEALGCHLSTPALDRLVDAVRRKAAERGRPFADHELIRLAAAFAFS